MSAAPSARAAGATVRDASWADAEPLSQTLARAFDDDPVIGHFLPDPARRAAKLPRLFRVLLKLGLRYRACHVTNGFEAATFWRPPDKWHLSMWDYVANGPEMLSIFGGGTLRVMNAMDHIEKRHPKEPHWYLQTIGTDPAKQGKGYGSLVMRHQLALVDAQRMPCYLESSKDTNVPIYQSFGFRVTGEIVLPTGPTMWPMWRDPVS